jgi:hypothetical protein
MSCKGPLIFSCLPGGQEHYFFEVAASYLHALSAPFSRPSHRLPLTCIVLRTPVFIAQTGAVLERSWLVPAPARREGLPRVSLGAS